MPLPAPSPMRWAWRPGTVTATVKRLADRGLARPQAVQGVELTPTGRRAAVAAIRRHRIVERFLSDMLGYAWNEADRLAASFEHELPQEVEDRLFVALDRPASCPHGFPIPEPETAEIPEMPPLYDLEPGDIAWSPCRAPPTPTSSSSSTRWAPPRRPRRGQRSTPSTGPSCSGSTGKTAPWARRSPTRSTSRKEHATA